MDRALLHAGAIQPSTVIASPPTSGSTPDSSSTQRVKPSRRRAEPAGPVVHSGGRGPVMATSRSLESSLVWDPEPSSKEKWATRPGSEAAGAGARGEASGAVGGAAEPVFSAGAGELPGGSQPAATIESAASVAAR